MGECGTSIQKITASCGTELVYCASTMGSITAFLPFETKEELDFFTHLEMYLRIES
jgi:splicing factor 3B subunit 3